MGEDNSTRDTHASSAAVGEAATASQVQAGVTAQPLLAQDDHDPQSPLANTASVTAYGSMTGTGWSRETGRNEQRRRSNDDSEPGRHTIE